MSNTYETILHQVKKIISDVTKMSENELPEHGSLIELGADSIILMEVNSNIKDVFGIYIPITLYFEDLTTVAEISEYIYNHADIKDEISSEVESDVRISEVQVDLEETKHQEIPKVQEKLSEGAINPLKSQLNEGSGRRRRHPNTNISRNYISKNYMKADTDNSSLMEFFHRQLDLMQEQLYVLSDFDSDSKREGQELADTYGIAEAMTEEVKESEEIKGLEEVKELEVIKGLEEIKESKVIKGLEEVKKSEVIKGLEEIKKSEVIKGIKGVKEIGAEACSEAEILSAEVVKPDISQAYVPYKKLNLKTRHMSAEQEICLNTIIREYENKTHSSKKYAAAYRQPYADCRSISGFRPNIKEIVYQLIFKSSEGAYITDIDNNTYIDLAMDFGVSLFGHNQDFIKSEIEEEMKKGFPLSLVSERSGRVAELICELTGVQRCAFYNSGSEAVMVALRISRAFTKKNKIVVFAGSYHGTFDGVLGTQVRGGGGHSAKPLAQGIPESYVNDLVVLEYGKEESLQYIKQNKDIIAAVLTEPVQSRNPELQPFEFLRELKTITVECGIVLIFDEMILGFRLGQNGAQGYYGVQADIVTYGKIAGGGMPIGIVAGKSAVMNCIDGGIWNYGDDSLPPEEENRTFTAGTFCHHPLAMAAAEAVLTKIKSSGSQLYDDLNRKTTYLVDHLNEYYVENNIPIKMIYCGSLFRFILNGNLELFYYLLILEGVYVWEGRNCFLSAAHTYEDLDLVIDAVKRVCTKLRPFYHGVPVKAEKRLPLNRSQSEMMVLQLGESGNNQLQEAFLIELKGNLTTDRLNDAMGMVMDRHELLRATLSENREEFIIHKTIKDVIQQAEYKGSLREEVERRMNHRFDYEKGPLLLLNILKSQDTGETALLIQANHLIADGWSLSVVYQELVEAYNSLILNNSPKFLETMSYAEYNQQQDSRIAVVSEEERREFYQKYYSIHNECLNLPFDRKGGETKKGSRFTLRRDITFIQSIRDIAAKLKCSPFLLQLSAFQMMLREICAQDSFVVGVPIAGQQQFLSRSIVGNCVEIRPFCANISSESTIQDLIAYNKTAMRDFESSIGLLPDVNDMEKDDITVPKFHAVFNMDRVPRTTAFNDTEVRMLPVPLQESFYNLFFNISELNDELIFDIDYNSSKISCELIQRWIQVYFDSIEEIREDTSVTFGELNVYNSSDDALACRAASAVSAASVMSEFLLQQGLSDMIPSPIQYAVIKDRDNRPRVTGSYGYLYLGRDRFDNINTQIYGRVLPSGTIEFIDMGNRCHYDRGRLISLGVIERELENIDGVMKSRVCWDKEPCIIKAYLYYDTNRTDFHRILNHCKKEFEFYRIPDQFYRCSTPECLQNDAVLLEMKQEALTETEQTVFNMVRKLTDNPQILKEDNLFYLGFNSLKIVQLMGLINHWKNGARLPLTKLQNRLSIQGIAELIDQSNRDGQAVVPPVSKGGFHDYSCASSAQRRLYVLCKMNPQSTAYNIPSIMELEGRFDIVKFRQAFDQCIQKHPMLRAVFMEQNGELYYSIVKEPKYSIPYYEEDSSQSYEQIKNSRINNFIQPFSLEQEPLFRIQIVKYSDVRHFILLDIHHLIFDGSSSLLLIQDVQKFYEESMVEESEYHYSDYVLWQDELYSSDYYKTQMNYWSDTFSELPERNGLFTDYQRPVNRTYSSDIAGKVLFQEQKNEVLQFCRQSECTPFSLFTAAINIVTAHYSDEKDVILGTVFEGRDDTAFQSIIGMFVNTVPLRTQVDFNMTAMEFLSGVQSNNAEVMENSSVSFEHIIELSKSMTQAGSNPLFDILISYQDMENSIPIRLGDAEAVFGELSQGSSRFDIELIIKERADSFYLEAVYSTELYNEDTVNRYMNSIEHILNGILGNKKQLLGKLECLSSEDKEEVLKKFNNTQVDYPMKTTIMDYFEEQAGEDGGRTALIFGEVSLSYEELNSKSNQIADRLLEIGLEPNDPVAVIMERSIEMILGIYAVLKAGGVYVPIDPTYPAERMGYMLKDCAPKACLLRGNGIDFIDDYGIPILDLLDCDSYYGNTGNPRRKTKADDLAYIIYTSGTTGQPKGVMCRHDGLMNRILWMQDSYRIGAEDVIMQKTTFTFDVSVWEILWWGMVGAKAVLLPNGGEREPSIIAKAIERYQVSVLHFVPSMLNTFLAYMRKNNSGVESFHSLRYVFSSGEALKVETLRNFNQTIRDKYRDTQLINLYGPTEASIDVTYYNCDHDYKRLPIGRPIANIQIYIMKDGRLCGVGMPGELCIAGIGLADGYINKEALTDELFIDNPFGEGKLYRTGDKAKWHSDGNIEYIGRMDDQIKLRGLRIELGEIATALYEIEGIQDAAVVVKKDGNDEDAVCAYIVSEAILDIPSVKKHLRKKLPAYAVPAFFMQIQQIPTTKNGKLDKRALPEIEFKSEREYINPVGKTEGAVSKAFAAVLGRDRVSATDDFFELGGHSLKAAKAVNLIEDFTGVRLEINDIFQNTTVQELSEFVDSKQSVGYEPIPKAEDRDYYPMSSAQKRIYVLQQMDEAETVYHMPAGIEFTAQLDRERVKEALLLLTKRHEILRTSFHIIEDEPVQVINEEAVIDFEYEEVNACTEDDKKELLRKFVRSFDLSTAPLFRVKLVLCSGQVSYLFFDMHHIISDGMSVNILISEFTRRYRGEALLEQGVQYKDYSLWLAGKDMSVQRAYWLNQFKGDIPVLDLPLDYARTTVQSFVGATVKGILDRSMMDSVQQISNETSSSEYMVYLSAFMILLSKYSRQEEIIVGSPISGRIHKDTENILGMFVNTLVLKGIPDEGMSFTHFLKEMKQTCLDAYKHQEYPFEELVEQVGVNRDVTRNPLFDIMFIYQNDPSNEMNLEGGNYKEIELEQRNSKFDLSLELQKVENGFQMEIEYRTDLFLEQSIRRVLEHYQCLLKEIIKDPNQKIGSIAMTSEQERLLIQKQFNRTEQNLNDGRTIIDYFEEQVYKNPYQRAVIYENEILNYKEFNSKVNRLAHTLRDMGVNSNVMAAVIMERSMELMIGIFGILKAGGIYVPIAPDYPLERVQYIMDDCKPSVCLLNDKTASWSEQLSVPVLNVSDQTVYAGNEANPVPVNGLKDLAYVIYTSGTTGQPKGVMCHHEGLINRILWGQDQYPIGTEDTVMQKTAYTFDVSLWELLWWSAAGASILLLPQGGEKEPEIIMEMIARHSVTVIHFVPSMLNVFLMYMEDNKKEEEKLQSIRYFFSSGEALKVSTLKKFNDIIRRERGDIRFINLYGPTEASIEVTYFECGYDYSRLPIGKPIANTSMYIMDGSHLCGIGVPGELCIGGIGLANGYLNKHELTAEKFIANPYEAGRLYLTGDLARWHEDGNIEYMGRMDDQVKVRGLRIELGEIEGALRKIKGIRNAAVITRDDLSGDAYICSYLVSEEDISIEAVKKELKKTLPDYMIPSYMMQMDEIPVTKNGKLDRKALPSIIMKSENLYLAPRNETEKLIADIYGDVLDMTNIGVKDDFFLLGGHSLRAAKAMNQIEKKTGIRLPLREIFANRTVEELSRLVSTQQKDAFTVIPEAEKKEFYPMSSAQKRLYILQQMEDTSITYNMPAGMVIEGELNERYLAEALTEVTTRHEALRTSFLVMDGQPVQKINDRSLIEFSYDSSGEYEEGDKERLLKEFQRPFQLDKAPLMRVQAIRCKNGSTLLFFDMHHIISDGMSINLMIKEVSAYYNRGTLERPEIQYKDYSEFMRGRDITAQKSYWCDQFADSIPVLEMPLDYSRGLQRTYEGDVISAKIDTAVKQGIQALSKETNCTEYMILLSAYMLTLSKYSNQEDIVVGSPISGRTHPDMERMIGMFVNTLALRGKPEKYKKFMEFLLEMKETCLQAYENQEYPFEDLVEETWQGRDMSRNPIFDTMFTLQNTETEILNLGELRVKEMIQGDVTAKFDFSLEVMEDEKGYGVNLEYCTGLFKKESMLGFLEHYQVVLEQILKNPNETIEKICPVGSEERGLLLDEWSGIKNYRTIENTVTELFEQQANLRAEEIAVIDKSSSLTYAELNNQSNCIANKLREIGITPDSTVIIYCSRNIDSIVGILGILKAGGAYIPIDPDSSPGSISYIIKDSGAKAIIYSEDEVACEVDLDVPFLCISTEKKCMLDCGNPVNWNEPDDLAYVMYTSGTTGRPKGVKIAHKSIVRLVKNTNYIELNENTVMLQTGAISFDASTFEIWGSLLNGGSLHIVEKELLLDAQELKNYIDNNRINTMWLTSSLFNKIVSGETELFHHLQYLLIGGEKLSTEHVKLFKEMNKHTKLINGYGPTENTTFTTTHEITEGFDTIPIGKPIANTQVYILNGMELCGIGMPGELCITGMGLASGYLNQKELSEEKFIDHPLTDTKLYRSGDLVRFNREGSIEYLGRIDEQVKVRGFRIELSGIKAVLLKQDNIKDAAVTLKEDLTGESIICAYFVSDVKVNRSSLREKLRDELPSYMMPSCIMQLPMIPLTNNGKLDTESLPVEMIQNEDYIAPRYEEETIVTELFSDILGVETVGVKDDFFELGGHSLRATKLVNRLEEATGVRLPLKDIFKNRTAENISLAIRQNIKKEYEQIPKAEQRESFLMSSAQKRTYVLQQLDECSVVYNMPSGLETFDELREERIREVLQILTRRHEILRTSFHLEDGRAIQRVHTEAVVDFICSSVKEMTADEKKAELEKFVRPFDLSKAPLLRIQVMKCEDGCSLIFFDMHHIISDGMSINILIHEFISLYNGEQLKELTIQYKDYSEWLRHQDLSKQKEYWLSQFEEGIPVLELPLDKSRGQIQTFDGAAVHGHIDLDLCEDMKALCRKTDSTEYILLLSIYMALLGRYANQEDIVVGSPISGRTHRDTEQLIGMFVNTLPMRGYPEKEKSFLSFIDEVKEVCISAYQNQEYPFEELVEALNVNRELSRNPIFDVMFTLQNNEQVTFATDSLRLKEITADQKTAKFDLLLQVYPVEHGYDVSLEYNTNLFEEVNVRFMLNHFINLLQRVVSDPEEKIGTIDMLDVKEYDILKKFNDTDKSYEVLDSATAYFELQTKKTPHHTAIVCGEESMSYEAFNTKTNQLAEKIRSMGILPDDRVAIMTERSMEMMIGIFGIMKAGGAYVPIPPDYPEERIKFLLADSRAKLCVVNGHNTWNEFAPDIPVLSLDRSDSFVGIGNNLKPVCSLDHLAYVIYTSGTTGQPKGVMCTHRGLINRILWAQDKYPMDENDVVMQKTTFTFDVSVWEILWWSFVGAKLVLLPQGGEKDPAVIKDEIYKNQVTVMHFVPSMMNQFLMYGDANPEEIGRLKSLRNIFSSGEALKVETLKLFNHIMRSAHKQLKLINVYGPTEASIDVTCFECGYDYNRIPIGKPISNCQIHILDNDTICGIGMPGELCIGGIVVARGYLNNEELTAEKFVQSCVSDGRIYRTGDLARWLPDGNIEYLGRFDTQIKIRGLRIELGEIESVLCEIEGIKEAVVLVKELAKEEQYICAYVVSDAALDESAIREELDKRLPSYMIPSLFMQIDKIPVTNNGKLNKKALPAMSFTSAKEYIAPADEFEEAILHIFSNVLNMDTIGMDDDFFELGGHSLKAAMLINQIEAAMKVRLPLKDIFNCRTAGRLCKRLNETDRTVYSIIKPAVKEEYYTMSSAQKRIYVLHQMDDAGITYNMPIGLETEGQLNKEKVFETLSLLTNTHEGLRTTFHMLEGEPVQRIHTDSEVDFLYEKMGELGEADKDKLFHAFIHPFDLENGPLLRVKLIVHRSGSLLFFDIHHIISDGLSLNNIIKEFSDLYNSGKSRELKIQYKDYSEWLKTRDLTKERDYWISRFQHDIPVLEFPCDFRRGQYQSFAGKTIRSIIPDETKCGIQSICAATGATEFMVMLSAYMVLLGKYSRQSDIIVGSPISGRTHKDTEQMLGVFINTLALRAYPEAEKGFIQFLLEVKEICLDAYENQDYPFEELVEEIPVNRDVSHNPLFDVMFTLQNTDDVKLNADGMEFKQLQYKNETAKFDLSLDVMQNCSECYVELEYSADLFEEASMHVFIQHYITLLHHIADNPKRKLKDLSPIGSDEFKVLTDTFNHTWMDYPKEKTVVEVFEHNVTLHSSETALICGDRTLTYGQLNRRANRIAHKLREMGIQPDDMVVIMGEPSEEIIIAMLGTLKAGGGYVPIDVSYPEERIRYIIKDCSAKAALFYNAEETVCGDIPILNLSDPSLYEEMEQNPQVVNKPADLMYMIYTSGTTGKPKGTMIEHRSVLNMITSYIELYEITPKDRILQYASISFDQSIFDIYIALLSGAALCLVPEHFKTDLSEFKRYVNQWKASVAALTPAFINELEIEDYPVFRILESGGAAANPETLNKWMKNCQIFNTYGPTETTVNSISYKCTSQITDKLPIGKPIGNTAVYIMNGMELCGIGMPGELCIAGDGLARGYFNKEELTRAKFIPNLYGEGRIYRTGDLARWLTDGNIEYMGRMDDQVKIRGFRIELQEIESVLRGMQEIQDAVVIAREDGSKDSQLYAYIVSEEAIDTDAISSRMEMELPGYMVPSYITQIDAIPLTRNGKLNKSELPIIEAKIKDNYMEPETENEKILADVFHTILGMNKIGLKDNFFHLGGDSIKAIRIISKLREYSFELSLKSIMKSPVLEDLALLMTKTEDDGIYDQVEVYGEVLFTPIQLEFFESRYAKPNHYNQSVLLMNENGIYEESARAAMHAIVEHHDILRAVFREGKQMIRRMEEGNLYELFQFDLRGYDTDEALQRAIDRECMNIQESMNIETGPMLKGGLLKTEQADYLMLCIHHLAVDGISWRILMEDFFTAYAQKQKGQELKLPLKTASYKEWSHLLHEYSRQEELQKEKLYWEEVIQNIDEGQVKGMPNSNEKGVGFDMFELDEALTWDLLYESRKAYNTEINDILLAALGLAVNKLTGQEKTMIRLEGHGREKLHRKLLIDRTVGWFTSIYPILLETKITAEKTLIMTKEMLRKVPNHGIGYGILQHFNQEFDKCSDISLCFNYLGDFDETFTDDNGFLFSEYTSGLNSAPENAEHYMDINGRIVSGRLNIEITYRKDGFSQEQVQQLGLNYMVSLKELITLCVSQEEGVKTASDFGELSMQEEEIDNLNDLLNGLL